MPCARPSKTEQDTQSRRIAIADVVVELRMKGVALTEAMLPTLAHLAAPVDAQRKPDITFHLWDGAETGVWPPCPPFNSEEYSRYGQRAIAYNGSISLMHALWDGMLYAYDRSTRQGCFWRRDAAQLSIYEQAAPVQTLFHWALRDYGWQSGCPAPRGTTTASLPSWCGGCPALHSTWRWSRRATAQRSANCSPASR